MNKTMNNRTQDNSNPCRFGVAILLAGTLTGLVAGAFFIALRFMGNLRVSLIGVAGESALSGWLVAVLAGLAATAVAAWMTEKYAPDAPQMAALEPADSSRCSTSASRLFTVNFAGTGLAAGAGLALGPERPMMQMSGAIGNLVARLTGLSQSDHELLMASTGGAGIAADHGNYGGISNAVAHDHRCDWRRACDSGPSLAGPGAWTVDWRGCDPDLCTAIWARKGKA
jgi:H+/Cl- antiporter ClcA